MKPLSILQHEKNDFVVSKKLEMLDGEKHIIATKKYNLIDSGFSLIKIQTFYLVFLKQKNTLRSRNLTLLI